MTRRGVDGLAVALLVAELGLPTRIRNEAGNGDARAVLTTGSHQSSEVLLQLGSVGAGEMKLQRIKILMKIIQPIKINVVKLNT